MNRRDFVERAVKILRFPNGTVQQKLAFLEQKGCTGGEITEALNEASGGELVRTALGVNVGSDLG